MRTLQAHFPPEAFATLESGLKHTKDVRVFRRAQAVWEVVKGHRIKAGLSHSRFPLGRYANGSNASPTKARKASWIAHVQDSRAK
jgi:hypothetical protein